MDPIQNVSDTAFLVAQCRAIESARTDALFYDPLAAELAGEKGRAIVAAYPTADMTGWTVAIRTVIIDELIRSAVARGVDLVVNLGAGLDTRPYRLELGNKPPRWVEVDFPAMIAFKAERLAGKRSLFAVESVSLDLSDLGARAAFFAELAARGHKTLVLTEGVIPYLTIEQVAALADDLRRLPNIEAWVVDYFSKDVHAYRDRQPELLREARFLFRPDDWFGFFSDHGWGAREVRYLPEEGARLRRNPPLPRGVRWLMTVLWPFVPRSRRDAFRRALAYVVLEPE